jgi:hypothetical protein
MKKSLFIILCLAFLGVGSTNPVLAQCDTDKHCEDCIKQIEEGFTYLKSYKIDGEGGAKTKVEYSYVFTKGAQYFLNICTGNNTADGIVLTIYDSTRKMVGTNYLNGKFFPVVKYPCSATGIYYITFTFEKPTNFCGGSVLGFKR